MTNSFDSTQSPVPRSKAQDVLFLGLMLLCLLLFMSLATYSPDDGGWVAIGQSNDGNAVGKVGAVVADLLFHTLGYLAFVLPVLLFAKLAMMFKSRRSVSTMGWVIRSIGILLTFSSASAFAHISIWKGNDLPAGAGGLLGDLVFGLLAPLFGFPGTLVILVSALALGLMLFLEFSWLAVFEALGGWMIEGLSRRKGSESQTDEYNAPGFEADPTHEGYRSASEPIEDSQYADQNAWDNDGALLEDTSGKPKVGKPVKIRHRNQPPESEEIDYDSVGWQEGTELGEHLREEVDEPQYYSVEASDGGASTSQASSSQNVRNAPVEKHSDPLSVVERFVPSVRNAPVERSSFRNKAKSSDQIEPYFGNLDELAEFTALPEHAHRSPPSSEPAETHSTDLANEEPSDDWDHEDTSGLPNGSEPLISEAFEYRELDGQFPASGDTARSHELPEPEENVGEAAQTSPEPLPWDDPNQVLSEIEQATDDLVARAEKVIPIQPLEKTDLELSDRAKKEMQGNLFKSQSPLPSIAVLDPPKTDQQPGFSAERLQELSELLVQKLRDFGVKVEVVAVAPGPVITRFEIQPAPGVKASKISNLAKDLARSMAMLSVRVVEVIPGKSVMGIEVPNEDRAVVSFREVLSSKAYDDSKSPLTLALGHDIGGNSVVTDLAKSPHMLVAGTTGSGKSVGVNAMILSMLFKATPDELRLILVDPKMLELSVYEGIPHLLTPVITDMKEAANGLRWSVAEMERRYQLLASQGVRNIASYNKKVKAAIAAGEPIIDPTWDITQSFDTTPRTLEPLPYIVIVIDEFADMMMMVGKKVEELIARIAQKARAAGIHMILATQRPSVDVITGLIKANIPTRIAFQVSSRIDSRTILDQGGAEQLLGYGDMLFMPPGIALPERVHGAFVDDDEVHRVVAEWKLRGEPDYLEEIVQTSEDGGVPGAGGGVAGGDEQDELFDQAVAFVTESGKCSTSSVQRKLRIGYNRAARLVEAMEAAGVVSPPAHNGSREVLAPPPPDVH